MLNWFGRKSAPAARVLPTYLGGGDTGGFARDYGAQINTVFRDNPVGQRSVRLVAGMVGGLSIYAEGDEAAARLVKAGGMLEQVAAAMLLHGNGYVQLAVGGDDRPAELMVLRPERVTMVPDRNGYPASYVYRVNARDYSLPMRDALERRVFAHVKSLNPAGDTLGAGCLDAAIAAASVHNAASRWNKALLDNAARPSGAMVYDPGDGSVLSGEQFERLRGELDEQFAGAANAGRPLLLDGGLKWQALSLTPADMDFVALKEGAARDIALAFGVPPVLVGLPGDATYANAREAGRALYRQTVLPLAERILEGLSAMLSDWFGPVRLAVDLDAISELAEDRARLWEVIGGADFLTREEKREQLGFSPDPTPSPSPEGEGR